jgi:hypothetical protein
MDPTTATKLALIVRIMRLRPTVKRARSIAWGGR